MEESVNQSTSVETPKRPRRPSTKKILAAILIVILLAAIVFGYLQMANNFAAGRQRNLQEIADLKKQVSELNTELEAEKAKNADNGDGEGEREPTDEEIANIKAAITSGNTAALEGYMAPKVLVIIAASEGIGERTPAQAVSDMDSYTSSATDPWDFNLPAATLADYQSGDYTQYFPASAVVGRSANDYVLSFSFNETAKIKTVFMSVNDDIL